VSAGVGERSDGLLRALGRWDMAFFLVGTVIGSGIFLVPSEIAREIRSEPATIAIWVAGGVLTMLGVLSIAELAAAIPAPGGIYTYIGRAYGRLPGFLCGWAIFTVITSGAIATLAVAFSIYLKGLLPLSPGAARGISILAVLLLTGGNVLGVRTGATVQNVLTVLKVAGLAGMTIAIFAFAGPGPTPSPVDRTALPNGAAGIGLALIGVFWAYEGWHDATFVAGEVKDPQKNFPAGVVLGELAIVALYVAANLAYFRVMSVEEIAGSPRVGLAAIGKVLGPWGVRALTAAIVCSILGAMNGSILAGPRAYYQMARDGLLPGALGDVHARFRTPAAAIALQGVWSCVLILFIGGFSQLFTYVIFGGWLMYALATAAVPILRRKEPDLARPFRVPGYPVVPALFVAAAAVMTVSTVLQRPRESLLGLGFIALGVPLYFLFRRAPRRGARSGRRPEGD
jgi:APA family basic amino acid/polyamine antiporter